MASPVGNFLEMTWKPPINIGSGKWYGYNQTWFINDLRPQDICGIWYAYCLVLFYVLKKDN